MIAESSRQHSHSHSTAHPANPEKQKHHPHATADPATRLARLLLFLEAQFGEDAVAPIPYPRSSSLNPANKPANTNGDNTPAPDAMDTAAAAELSAEDKAELKRLHNLGVPVPGVEIRFDRFVARVWLEGLEVECGNNALRARVKAVVERGVETVSGLWR
jgi:cleavage and polyadenylation specificity factor subunit 3